MSSVIDVEHWEQRLRVLAERHGVPGAQLGILRQDELVTVAAGILHAGSGAPATVDSMWQLGSITKVWTATLIMQLIDEGHLALDTPVPGLPLGVTVRHLLTHTSGIDGDVFTDTGRGDDCLERYVAGLADVAQNQPVGATWSYCNSGFVVLGRIVEQVTGQTWDRAVRERLVAPLGLQRTCTLPEEVLRHPHATGHVTTLPEARITALATLPRSMGPAGLLTSDAADLLAFARMHMAGGVAADGTRLLAERSALAMRTHQVECPGKNGIADAWGLGWCLHDWGADELYGHDGTTIGQSAFLRILPRAGLAVTLLTNVLDAKELCRELFGEIFGALAGTAPPAPIRIPRQPVEADIGRHLGTYRRESFLLEVYEEDGEPRLRVTVTGPFAAMAPEPVTTYVLAPVAENLYAATAPGQSCPSPVHFSVLPTGASYVHLGGRAAPRVD